MWGLGSHLNAGEHHDRLAYRHDCPLCRDRLAGQIHTHGAIGRKAVVGAVVFALASAAAPPGSRADDPFAPGDDSGGIDDGGGSGDAEEDRGGDDNGDVDSPPPSSSEPDTEGDRDRSPNPAPTPSPSPAPTAPAPPEPAPAPSPGPAAPVPAPPAAPPPIPPPPPPAPPAAPPPETLAPAPVPPAAPPSATPSPAPSPPAGPPQPSAGGVRGDGTGRGGRSEKAASTHERATRDRVPQVGSFDNALRGPAPANHASHQRLAAPAEPGDSTTSPPRQVLPTPGIASRNGTYVVQSGDSLWSIASHGLGAGASDVSIAAYVSQLWDANASTITTGSPDLIVPGMSLRLP